MKAHEGDYRVPGMGEIEFKAHNCKEMDGTIRHDPEPTCSYCGSISIDAAIKAFQTPGVRWSGSDWKYGWPHKFYIEIPCEPYRFCSSSCSSAPEGERFGYSTKSLEHRKFYSEHLKDATPEQIHQWNAIVAPITGVDFEVDEKGLKWIAIPGHQGWGEIDKDGKSFDYMNKEVT